VDPIRDLVPIDKFDLARASAAVDAGYPTIEPVLGALIEWLQDCNWPVATVLLPLLRSVGAPIAPHIWRVLESNDNIWKYWVIGQLLPSLPEDTAVQFRPVLAQLSRHPRASRRTR
jgi:hypothetical protein